MAAAFESLILGALLVVAGALVVLGVTRELEAGQRFNWRLALGIGGGVVSLAAKVVLIIVFGAAPGAFLDLLPQRAYAAVSIPDSDDGEGVVEHIPWEALPRSAPFPAHNPPSDAKVRLGKQLFNDKRLSVDNTVACVSCHQLTEQLGGADGRAVAEGVAGQTGGRNAPTVLNAAFQGHLFWDGRASSLEEQALGPLVNPVEMGMSSVSAAVEKLQSIPEYREAFAAAFPSRPGIDATNLAAAIATYERTLITPDSAYDRFVLGDTDALTPQQQRGMALFRSVGCSGCHSGANFSSASLLESDAALRLFPANARPELIERYEFSEDKGAAQNSSEEGPGVWRVPSLRNVSRTAPYFHNGAVESLEEAVRLMAQLQLGKALSNEKTDDVVAYWQPGEQRYELRRGQALSDAEISDIAEFLRSLNGELPSD